MGYVSFEFPISLSQTVIASVKGSADKQNKYLMNAVPRLSSCYSVDLDQDTQKAI